MNGAEALVRTMAGAGVEVCFANPGTSEMHFVAALDRVPGVRCVLAAFEGGATGAADGYARMAEKPAATLLHLGTGLANGIANIHNAKRARTPMVNVVGEHATHHLPWDSPLTSDVEGLARPVSDWLGRAWTAEEVGPKAAEAIAAAGGVPGRIATLVLPADASWSEGGVVGAVPVAAARPGADPDRLKEAVRALERGDAIMLLGGTALRAGCLDLAAAVSAKTGAKLLAQSRDPRMERGAGRVPIARVSTITSAAVESLKSIRAVVLVGARIPVANFAHPGRPSVFTPPGIETIALADGGEDMAAVLGALADAVGARVDPSARAARADLVPATGVTNPDAVAQSIAALMPENAILIDEAVTSGRPLWAKTVGAAPHDYLSLTGGAIGMGLPAGAGASIACPDRKVICLQADGSGLYTVQSLWTHAREGLDILTVIFANREYAVLRAEQKNVGITDPGENAIAMLTLDRPPVDWVSVARGFGVEAARATDMEGFNAAMAAGLSRRGPYLVEVVL